MPPAWVRSRSDTNRSYASGNSELIEQAGDNRVAGVGPRTVAGEQHAEPVDARRAGWRREADGSVGIDHREIRDVQFLEEIAAAHAQLAGEVVLGVDSEAMPRIGDVGQRDELSRALQAG